MHYFPLEPRRAFIFALTFWALAGAGCYTSSQPADDGDRVVPLQSLEPEEQADQLRAAGQWPAWRGVRSQGVAGDESTPSKFSPKSEIAWKTPLPGSGNCSPIVWDDWIFLTCEHGHGNRSLLRLICIDRRDGQIAWSTDLATAEGATHRKNGHASSTPATDGKWVYTFAGSGGLFCHDFAGKQIWKLDLNPPEHEWGAASSPVLFGDLVIQLCDGQSESFLAAVDRRSGRLRWRTDRQSHGCWSTPVIVATAAGQSELVVNGTGSPGGGDVVAYDPASGEERWRRHGTTDVVCPTPIIASGLVISTSGRNGPILALRPGPEGEVDRLAWSTSRGGPYVPTGLAYEGKLYLLDDAGELTCYEAVTGKPVFSRRLRGKFTASLVAGGGKLFAANEDGVVYVLATGGAFQVLNSNPMEERITATPALSRGELFLRTARHLYCVRRPAPSAAPEESTDDLGQRHAVGKVIADDVPQPSPSPSDAWLSAPDTSAP